MDTGARSGLSFGFGLAGLMAAGLAYYAANHGAFSGPAWLATLVAVSIGVVSGVTMLGADRVLRGRLGARPGKPVKLRGPWACPQCGSAYVPEAAECSDCHVPLVGTKS